MTEEKSPELVEYACEHGLLEKLLDEYIIFCCEEGKKEDLPDEKHKSKSKGSERFPNVAGFCRYFGIGQGRYLRLAKKFPDEFEKLSAVFEDEALNAQISPSLLTAYLKRRLGYGEEDNKQHSDVEIGQMRLIFEHDILSDGE